MAVDGGSHAACDAVCEGKGQGSVPRARVAQQPGHSMGAQRRGPSAPCRRSRALSGSIRGDRAAHLLARRRLIKRVAAHCPASTDPWDKGSLQERPALEGEREAGQCDAKRPRRCLVQHGTQACAPHILAWLRQLGASRCEEGFVEEVAAGFDPLPPRVPFCDWPTRESARPADTGRKAFRLLDAAPPLPPAELVAPGLARLDLGFLAAACSSDAATVTLHLCYEDLPIRAHLLHRLSRRRWPSRPSCLSEAAAVLRSLPRLRRSRQQIGREAMETASRRPFSRRASQIDAPRARQT